MNIKLTNKELEIINNYCICQKDNPCNICPTEQRWSCCGCPPEKEFKSKNKNTLESLSENFDIVIEVVTNTLKYQQVYQQQLTKIRNQ